MKFNEILQKSDWIQRLLRINRIDDTSWHLHHADDMHCLQLVARDSIACSIESQLQRWRMQAGLAWMGVSSDTTHGLAPSASIADTKPAMSRSTALDAGRAQHHAQLWKQLHRCRFSGDVSNSNHLAVELNLCVACE